MLGNASCGLCAAKHGKHFIWCDNHKGGDDVVTEVERRACSVCGLYDMCHSGPCIASLVAANTLQLSRLVSKAHDFIANMGTTKLFNARECDEMAAYMREEVHFIRGVVLSATKPQETKASQEIAATPSL